MNKRIILASAISIAAIGAISLAPIAASALTTQNQMHKGSGYSMGRGNGGNGSQIKAEALNMTTEQLREQLQTKTLSEVITDQDMTLDQYHEKVQAAAQDRWKAMGLSQEEIQTRTQDQLDRQENCDGAGTGSGQGGYRGGQNR
jgi:multidrug efflux pump subunit AcrB